MGNANRPGLDQVLAALNEGFTPVSPRSTDWRELIAVYAKNGGRKQPVAAARRRAPGLHGGQPALCPVRVQPAMLCEGRARSDRTRPPYAVNRDVVQAAWLTR